MHFEVLVEDQSGSLAIDVFLEKILGPNKTNHSWRLHSYRGIGHIPKGLNRASDPAKRLLLNNLPRLLRGYGRSLRESGAAVIVVLDSDARDCVSFKQELLHLLRSCNPQPITLFRIAVEESEAWLLGDVAAIRTAYPRVKSTVLDQYQQDSICGTWETLADAIHTGGAVRLKRTGWRAVGAAKSDWARNIAPHVDVERNLSKSFQVFKDGVRMLAENTSRK